MYSSHLCKAWSILSLAVILFISVPANTGAQTWPLSSGRAISRSGRWMAPVSSFTLSSDESDHLRRGSVDAWDISAAYGAAVYPMGPGQVVYAGCNNVGGYGCWALIDHKNDYTSLYAHLIDEGGGKVWVHTGDVVGTWTPLGRVGWTGMTSFGPHVHWEIRHKNTGRVRIDHLFPRFQMDYCKFCGPTGKSGGLNAVIGQPLLRGYGALAEPRNALVLLLLLLLFVLLARPATAIRLARGAGVALLRTVRASSMRIRRFRRSSTWPVAHVALLILVPSLLCGSTTAIGVWIADEGISPSAIWRYVRFGLSPVTGPGYQPGLRYSAVWGTPCGDVGTLGRTCRAAEIIQAGIRWQEEIFQFTHIQPSFAVIPRLNARFGYRQMEDLIVETHFAGGLVIADVAADILEAQEIIDRLTPLGLDGVAIDMEFADVVTSEEIERLANHMAQRRRQEGLQHDGVLIVWDVFHNLRVNQPIEVDGVQIVPVFTGYGSTETKIAGLTVTQRLFGVEPSASGLMAFDQRWPINRACRTFDPKMGFDCQDWRNLFAKSKSGAVGWWVQQ